ncbi:C40 family peptidase [Crocosphaera sp. UHCC 0190]|uniref:C40 family peptidase n=1 Tax=Crocosphaera sp. UHCC 0190 TaxID=3110246 RepID=UPI002B206B01|nr:C40 family peptidase [Crocosphaera sp. UHCC 0190]MEA5508543.1 C40 family peptidase [Crocosphaera sp. UHCC 0190]
MLVLPSPITSLELLPPSASGEYCCRVPLNLYSSSTGEELATQAAKGRHLKVLEATVKETAIQVQLCEEGYTAWLPLSDLNVLEPAKQPYRSIVVSRREIEKRLPEIIAFTKAAMNQPNYYLWGGTVGPNYDCSGLMQGAFSASGIWLPRDSYQQEAFCKKISYGELLPGDLIFFGTERVDHVALYLGDGYYIHSSGQAVGRNRIAIDPLSNQGDKISKGYYEKLWSFGRVMYSYCS